MKLMEGFIIEIDKIRIKKIDYYLFVLVFLILISCLAIYYKYIFGNRLFLFQDVGSDTKDSYLMFYNLYANKLIHHSFSFYDFTSGLGSNIISGQLYLFDPFSIILVITGYLFSISSIASALIYVNIFKIVCSGIFCYMFLKSHHVSGISNLIASYIYAFNGFIILWGQHYFFATFIVLLPLLLLCIEKCLSNIKYFPILSLVVCVSIIFGLYFFYMALLLCFAYGLIRYFQIVEVFKFKKFVTVIKNFFIWITLGLGLSSLVMMPVMSQMLEVSGRINNGESLSSKIINTMFTLYKPEYYKNLFFRFFSNNFQGAGIYYNGFHNYYEGIIVFFSILFIILFPQFIINIFRLKGTKLNRAATLIGILLSGCVLVFPIFSLVINGFAYPFTRQGFLLMPLFAVAIAKTLDEIIVRRIINKKLLLLSMVFCIIVVINRILSIESLPVKIGSSSYRHQKLFYIGIFACILIMGISMFLLSLKTKSFIRNTAILLLLASVGFNMCSDSFLTNNERKAVLKNSLNYQSLYDSNVEKCIKYIDEIDKSFYRVEKDYTTISRSMESMPQQYRSVTFYSSLINKNTIEYKRKILQSKKGLFIALIYKDYSIEQLSLLNVKYIISKTSIADKNLQFVKQFGEILLFKNTLANQIGTFFTSSITSAELDKINSVSEINNITKKAIVLDYKSKYDKPINSLTESNVNQSSIYFKAPENNYIVEGEIDTKVPGMLFVAIPYEKGWRAYLNGKQVQIERANYGFMGLEVNTGKNKIVLKYETPYLYIGIVISIIFLLLYIIMCFILIKKEKTNA